MTGPTTFILGGRTSIARARLMASFARPVTNPPAARLFNELRYTRSRQPAPTSRCCRKRHARRAPPDRTTFSAANLRNPHTRNCTLPAVNNQAAALKSMCALTSIMTDIELCVRAVLWSESSRASGCQHTRIATDKSASSCAPVAPDLLPLSTEAHFC